MSLLQPPPEVFALFDDLILMDQGQIIYHGPVQSVMTHFESIGYACPPRMDTADFLQEVTSVEARRYFVSKDRTALVGVSSFVDAYKESEHYLRQQQLLDAVSDRYKYRLMTDLNLNLLVMLGI